MTIESIIKELEKRYYLVPKEVVFNSKDRVSFATNVAKCACEDRGISFSELNNYKTTQHETNTRYIALLLIKKYSKLNIGTTLLSQVFNRTHSTIDSNQKTANNLLETCKIFKSEYLKCELSLVNKFDL